MPPSCAVHLPNTSLYLPTCLDGGQKFISEGFNQDLKDVSKGFIIRNPTIKSSMSVCLIVACRQNQKLSQIKLHTLPFSHKIQMLETPRDF